MVEAGEKGFIQWRVGFYVPAVVIRVNTKGSTLSVILLDTIPYTVWEKGDQINIERHEWHARKPEQILNCYFQEIKNENA